MKEIIDKINCSFKYTYWLFITIKTNKSSWKKLKQYITTIVQFIRCTI